MKLTVPTLLEGIAEALREQVSPRLEDGFAREAGRMAQSLILIAARGADDAAAIRIDENAKMRAIFARASRVVDDGELAGRLADAAQSAEPGYRISELDAETGRLRALLIELHAHLEEQEGDAARELDRAIWRAMKDFEAARAPRA